MLVGILSDTHDRVEAMALGVELLRQAGAAYFIHCGDVGSQAVLDHLVGLPAAFVFGNTDWDVASLRRYAATVGVQCLERFGSVELDGVKIAVTHGDNGPLLSGLIESQEYDYICVGHTHVAGEESYGRTRLINPGALHRAKVKTVALLNTATGDVRWLPLAGA